MQNRRQKNFDRGDLRVCRGLNILKFDKTLLMYSDSYFNLGGLELGWGN